MDDGKGSFVPITKQMCELYEAGQTTEDLARGLGAGVFAVGDIVELRGSRFRVRKITKKDLVLRLLPREGGNR